MCFHKRLISQLVQILLSYGLNTRLTAKFFVVFQLDVVVFSIKNNKLIVSVDVNDRNEIRDKRVFGLFYKRLTAWSSSCPLRLID